MGQGPGQGERGGRQGEAKLGAAGAEEGSASVQMWMCACMCLRGVRREEEEQERSLNLILLSRFQVRQGEASEDHGTAVQRGDGTRRDVSEAEQDSGQKTA